MKKLLFAINVGWYYDLHWKHRVDSTMTTGYSPHLCMSKPTKITGNIHSLSLKRSSLGIVDNVKTFCQTITIFNKVKPDLIHSVTIKPNIMFGLLAWYSKVPILLTVPGVGSMFSQTKWSSKLVAKLILCLYRLVGRNKRSRFVFENSTDMQLFIENNICTTFNGFTVPGSGVDVDEYRAECIEVTPQSLKLLFAARLLEGKGLRELVQAVESLKSKGLDVELNVAGIVDDDSNEAISIKQLEDWHQQGKVNWIGQVNNAMCDVISANDVVVLPTRYGEGLPRILIEANACQRPVISTNIAGCKDFVIDGETGLLVSPSDQAALENAILKLSDRQYSRKLGIKGREHVLSKYTVKHVIASYKKIYDDLQV
ncbi:hypothetical protein BCT90_18965 [Vibrio lentus]|uniref:glycosyltransferase family 4 protein n=1 Tax=Vibrio lentus TaxID=136468 RepID=UPI000C834621|nr:glycosyltransferase family 4 protein [Vibrio lentus]PMI06655.1 hypothetical protein BCU53_12210 [Vibrio lentus]PML02527.1 hypothetical protein BCT90_18965 [Vibrio lentus]